MIIKQQQQQQQQNNEFKYMLFAREIMQLPKQSRLQPRRKVPSKISCLQSHYIT